MYPKTQIIITHIDAVEVPNDREFYEYLETTPLSKIPVGSITDLTCFITKEMIKTKTYNILGKQYRIGVSNQASKILGNLLDFQEDLIKENNILSARNRELNKKLYMLNHRKLSFFDRLSFLLTGNFHIID